jgi:hypothetical protein
MSKRTRWLPSSGGILYIFLCVPIIILLPAKIVPKIGALLIVVAGAYAGDYRNRWLREKRNEHHKAKNSGAKV